MVRDGASACAGCWQLVKTVGMISLIVRSAVVPMAYYSVRQEARKEVGWPWQSPRQVPHPIPFRKASPRCRLQSTPSRQRGINAIRAGSRTLPRYDIEAPYPRRGRIGSEPCSSRISKRPPGPMAMHRKT